MLDGPASSPTRPAKRSTSPRSSPRPAPRSTRSPRRRRGCSARSSRAATAFGDGRTPTWARIRIGDVVGFVPWSCLIAPDRYDARPPADVRFGAENDLLEVSRGRVASTGGIPWDEVLAADPDREAIDALVFATEPRFLPSGEPMEALPTEFVAATPADRFFFGREQAGRLLAAMSAAPPDAEVTARVRAIGDAVADSSRLPRPYAEWIWVVLDAPEILDCFAMPGGFVFVTTGLLDAVANDDELAAILGREVARLEAGVAMPAIGRALASRADDLRLRARGGDDAIGDADRWTDVTDTVVGIDEGPSPIAAVVDRSSIGLESRLDGRGVALAAAAGFDPWALTDLVVRMNERSLGVPGLRTAPEDALDLAARTAEIVRTRGDAVAEVESPDASDGVDDAPSAGSDAATDASAPASASASDVDSTGVDGTDSVVDGETDGETEGGRDDRDGASDSEASSATNPPAEPGTAPEVD